MWDKMSWHETSCGTKRPGTKHPETKRPWYETEMVRNIQHLKGNVCILFITGYSKSRHFGTVDILAQYAFQE